MFMHSTDSSTGLDCVDLKTNPSTLTAEQLRLISSDALQGYATCLEALNTDGYDRTKLNYLSETVQQVLLDMMYQCLWFDVRSQAISTPNAWSKQELEKLGVVLIGFSASIIGDIATEKVSEEEVVNSIGRHWISQPDDEIRSRVRIGISRTMTIIILSFSIRPFCRWSTQQRGSRMPLKSNPRIFWISATSLVGCQLTILKGSASIRCSMTNIL